jgi:hypothetical protein
MVYVTYSDSSIVITNRQGNFKRNVLYRGSFTSVLGER